MFRQQFKKPVELGSGSYGTVYSNSVNNAVKITVLDSFDKLQSTLRELHALRHLQSLKDKHLFVPMHKVLYNSSGFHIFMRRAEKNLHEVDSKDVTGSMVEKWAITMFKALFIMRKHMFLHRDIKPENILVKNNDLWLCDFGLSRHLHDTEVENGTGYIVTRWYRSPELLKHQKKNEKKANLKYCEKMDVWSVGCILYELIFDRVLAPGKNIDDVLKFIERRVNKLQKASLENHEKITKRMAKCLKGILSIDSKKRYDCAHALYALGELTAEEYVEYQTKKAEKTSDTTLVFAQLQPDRDTYTSDEWNLRQQLVLKAYKKFNNMKKIIAYAIVILDQTFKFDVAEEFAWAMIYSAFVLGSYYNNERCRILVESYRRIVDEERDNQYLIDTLADFAVDYTSVEVSMWESKKYKSFSMFLATVLKNPLKKSKV